jgi:SAM-dependent methyltransferase
MLYELGLSFGRDTSDSFDVVFSLSSIEHCGGRLAAGRAVQGMARAPRPGGVLVRTAELILGHSCCYQEAMSG